MSAVPLRNIRLLLVTGVLAMFGTMVFAKTGVLVSHDAFGSSGDSLAALQSRFGLGYWTAYAISWLIMAALTAGPYGFYAALVASGVGIALAIALAAIYWVIRSWTRSQIQAY